MSEPKMIEVVRSFSRKVNLGQYESADFFCSRKEECAAEDAARVSQHLFDFCRAEVEKDVQKFLADRRNSPGGNRR